jgi:hypothetical protein
MTFILPIAIFILVLGPVLLPLAITAFHAIARTYQPA